MANNQQILILRPSDIRFTQDSICDRFSNRTALENTYEKLFYGDLEVNDLPKIEVVCNEGVWWVIEGNRRLFLLKRLEELKQLSEVEVVVKDLKDPKVKAVYKQKKTTKSDGRSIICRRDRLEKKLREIDNKYDDEQNQKLIEQCSLERQDSGDYVDHYYVPDILPGSCRRKYREYI